MSSKKHSQIIIQGARTNNLKNISIDIPHHKFIVVTGISGSGKSSLAFEILAKEGQRRYFETLPSFARQFLGKLSRPDVDNIEGLSPVIAIGQRTTGMHPRSTVGTMSDIYDLLRLLYARTGESQKPIKCSRALFSFNSEIGKCKHCNGIGKEEKIDLNRLICFPDRTIREGALAPTLPNGYIMYSQVTMTVLNQVCEAEGFSVDIPWNELTSEQQHVILFGSEKIKVPFGKHSLESRLKWTGIKAKPREEGYYKGMIPTMTDILRRDRNANILKYVHSITCSKCNGTRLNDDALSVHVYDKSIADVNGMELNELTLWIKSKSWNEISSAITEKILDQLMLLEDLGLGHLTLDRTSKSLRASEIQRIRIANQILVPLSDVLYVFDEPSIGLHQEEKKRMIHHFTRLVLKGNTVIVVEHDLETIRSADHIIELGPKAGVDGGEIVFNGALSSFLKEKKLKDNSFTYKAIHNSIVKTKSANLNSKIKSLKLIGCKKRNLKNIDVEFKLGKLNVVSGKSGTGKSSLVKDTLLKVVQKHLGKNLEIKLAVEYSENFDLINKLIFIDHSPIGKTPRSNPATYLGISDHIRDLYASLSASKEKGFTKSRFSFNNKGGRCETCQGAGKTQIGMHYLGNIDLVCGTCNGSRFNEETLRIKYEGLSIADVYQLSINEALSFFSNQKKILNGIKTLSEIGLGYLTLGQSSTTLSGGEAQRIKIANQIQKKDTGDTLYIIIEPSIGLHHKDINSLLELFDTIKEKGNTIVCIEQNEMVIKWSDWHIELGPKGGAAGGAIYHQGIPKRQLEFKETTIKKIPLSHPNTNEIILNGVTTHGLKNVNVIIPKNRLTVVTGLSGSGKSSLVYETLFSESNARFTESLSTFNRSLIQQNSTATLSSFSNLGPAIGINRKGRTASKRSSVGTQSGIYNAFRLMYSRIAQQKGKSFSAQHFSYNHYLGACTECQGLGLIIQCNPDEIIINPKESIFSSALNTNKALQYYGDKNGQFIATLKEAAKRNDWNLDQPWKELGKDIQEAILYGTGEKVWDVNWKFNTKSRSGEQSLNAKWLGLCEYINKEFQRKRNNKNTRLLEDLMHEVQCSQCQGSRLKPELLEITFFDKNIYELSKMRIADCLKFFKTIALAKDSVVYSISDFILPTILESMQTILNLGLGYLNINRSIKSLSGGERQRITLAGQLSNNLYGVTYVLDEPTIGLDQEQVEILSNVLNKIVTNGNTVVVIEHNLQFIQTAEYLIEMGPGAGNLGGEIIFQGKLDELYKVKNSITYQLLNKNNAATPVANFGQGKIFRITNASANNLKNIDVSFYADQLIAVKGVSGSGKSSLINEVLYGSWLRKKPTKCASINGLDQFDEVVMISQNAQPQNRLSTPASMTGILELIKTIFSKTTTAKEAGLKKGDFSYISKNGKCPSCGGYGKIKTSMDYLSDIWLSCDRCNGMRYHENILNCHLKSRSIGDILKMTVFQAIDFFEDKNIIEQLKLLKRLGIGHLTLGQSGNTLSSGEAQRIKLANAMTTQHKEKTLYLFDEPSIGLHYFDILNLIKVFHSLIEDGNTVLFIEHNETLIQAANQVITLGPASGENGGQLI